MVRAVRVSATVTVASSPSGTFATMIPIMNTTASTMPYLGRAIAKNTIPITPAHPDTMWMK
jgi:hypothetical protein